MALLRFSGNCPDCWDGAFEGVAQFYHIGDAGFTDCLLHLEWADSLMDYEKANVGHVEFVVAAHHFREDEVNCMRTEEPEKSCFGTCDGNDVAFPFGAEEDLIFTEKVGEIQAFWLKCQICAIHCVPGAIVLHEKWQLGKGDDGIDIQRGLEVRRRIFKPKTKRGASVENQ